jgi:hypothetical protein
MKRECAEVTAHARARVTELSIASHNRRLKLNGVAPVWPAPATALHNTVVVLETRAQAQAQAQAQVQVQIQVQEQVQAQVQVQVRKHTVLA